MSTNSVGPQHGASEVWTEEWTSFSAHTLYCETDGINLPQMKARGLKQEISVY